jgi:hypothetical protein
VTVTTTARAALATSNSRIAYGMAVPVACLFSVIPLALLDRRRLATTIFLSICVLGGCLCIAGCGPGKSSANSSAASASTGTQPGGATLTITGTAMSGSASLVHTTKVQLTIN